MTRSTSGTAPSSAASASWAGVRLRAVLRAPVQADDDHLRPGGPRRAGVGGDPCRVDQVRRPRRAVRQLVAVEPVGVGEVGDGGATHVVERGAAASSALRAVPVWPSPARSKPSSVATTPSKPPSRLWFDAVEQPSYPVAAMAGASSCGAWNEGYPAHGLPVGDEWHLEVAEGEVRVADDRGERGEEGAEVVRRADRRAVVAGRPDQGEVGQDVAPERQGDLDLRDRGGRRRRGGRGATREDDVAPVVAVGSVSRLGGVRPRSSTRRRPRRPRRR